MTRKHRVLLVPAPDQERRRSQRRVTCRGHGRESRWRTSEGLPWSALLPPFQGIGFVVGGVSTGLPRPRPTMAHTGAVKYMYPFIEFSVAHEMTSIARAQTPSWEALLHDSSLRAPPT